MVALAAIAMGDWRMTDKADLDRALALAVSECLKHGGCERDIEVLRKQFKALATEEENQPDKKIPE